MLTMHSIIVMLLHTANRPIFIKIIINVKPPQRPSGALTLSIFTFLLSVETQAKEGFDKSFYLDLSKPCVYKEYIPRIPTN